MGLPAARVGDSTTHGTPLGPGPGCVTVLIGGRPAWRAIVDTHVCPLGSGSILHVGGVVPVGSATVRIGCAAAARAGDAVSETGPPNTIVSGALTVLVG